MTNGLRTVAHKQELRTTYPIGLALQVLSRTPSTGRFEDRLNCRGCEQIVKAFSLGAGDFDVAYRVVLKQIWPRVLNSIRLNLKAVMLFLFAGEMIASTDGLAYRIALLRRHMGMDVIIPYVLWVALLLFLVDLSMRLVNRWLHPWFKEA